MIKRTCICIGSVIIIAGCSSGPTGDAGGRVPIGEMTPGERRADQMPTPDLAEASDKVAMQLAHDIDEIIELDNQGMRATVMLGDIVNKTDTMRTTDFEYMRNRIKSKLLQSRHIVENVQFVAGRQRMEALNRREYGEGREDLLQEGTGGGVGVQRGNPYYSYYLNAECYGVHRGGTHLFSVTFELHRVSDGAIVFNRSYERKYR